MIRFDTVSTVMIRALNLRPVWLDVAVVYWLTRRLWFMDTCGSIDPVLTYLHRPDFMIDTDSIFSQSIQEVITDESIT